MLTFFLDENMSPCLAPLLNHLARGGHSVCHLSEHFQRGTKDEVWIPEVGKNGWILIGGDGRQFSIPQQRQLLQEYRVTAFCMYGRFMKANGYEQTWRLVRAWPDVVKAAEKARPGTWFDIAEGCKVEPHGKK